MKKMRPLPCFVSTPRVLGIYRQYTMGMSGGVNHLSHQYRTTGKPKNQHLYDNEPGAASALPAAISQKAGPEATYGRKIAVSSQFLNFTMSKP